MSVFERLLKSDNTELPDCRCGRQMEIDRIELVPDSEARLRIYQCQYCGSELRLTESATTDAGMATSQDNSTNRNEDRRAWVENHRRELAEDRKIGRIILGSLAALALLCGLIVIFSGGTSNVADRSKPMTTGSTGTAPSNPLTK